MTAYRLIFGLSADPVHVGHTAMVTQGVQALADRLYEVTGVLLIPVYRRNPVGSDKVRLPDTFAHRLAQCRLAAREIAARLGKPPGYVQVSAIEAELARGRPGPNYTVETLKILKLRTPPGEGLIFLVSSELVSGLTPQLVRWRSPAQLLRLAHLAICPRPGYPLNVPFVQAAARRGRRIIVLSEVETPAVASTELRARLQAGVSPLALAHQRLLPISIARYLAAHRLYA
jgi:nicotinate (nicotinamide) nucleotide adenylyltransferase